MLKIGRSKVASQRRVERLYPRGELQPPGAATARRLCLFANLALGQSACGDEPSPPRLCNGGAADHRVGSARFAAAIWTPCRRSAVCLKPQRVADKHRGE